MMFSRLSDLLFQALCTKPRKLEAGSVNVAASPRPYHQGVRLDF
jgi:hypothetical protein